MMPKMMTMVLVGAALAVGTWAWAQQAVPQPPMGSGGQGSPGYGYGMGPGYGYGMGPGMMGGPGYGWGGPGYGMGPGMMGGWASGWYQKRRFTSNGEQIYYTGTSRITGPIPRTGGPPWAQQVGVGCVACHGVHGQGGVPIMMGTVIPPDIRYGVLTGKVPEPGGEEMDHPPYTDALIERAITQGTDPAGKPLDWTMPRWQMGEQDLTYLVAYLKTLR